KKFNLYSNVRPVISFKGTKARYENIDIITIRENTEGMYSGHGQVVSADGLVAEATSIVTRDGAERIAVFAFETARREKRKKVTMVYKASILKSSGSVFLTTAREGATRYAGSGAQGMIVDTACMQLVMSPQHFDVIVSTILLGDILS